MSGKGRKDRRQSAPSRTGVFRLPAGRKEKMNDELGAFLTTESSELTLLYRPRPVAGGKRRALHVKASARVGRRKGGPVVVVEQVDGGHKRQPSIYNSARRVRLYRPSQQSQVIGRPAVKESRLGGRSCPGRAIAAPVGNPTSSQNAVHSIQASRSFTDCKEFCPVMRAASARRPRAPRARPRNIRQQPDKRSANGR